MSGTTSTGKSRMAEFQVYAGGKWKSQKGDGRIFRTNLFMTPKDAANLLKKNTRNRTLSKANVAKIRTDILMGNWRNNSNTIGFLVDGTLADGQTRLTALKEAGETNPDIKIDMGFSFGLPEDALSCIDNGGIRTQRHLGQIMFDDLKKGALEMPAFYLQMVGIRNKTSNVQRLIMFDKTIDSVNFILDCYDNHKSGVSTHGVFTSYITSALYAAKLSGEVTDDQIEAFIRVLLTGIPKNDQEATIIRFRDMIKNNCRRVSAGGETRPEFFLRTQKALKNYIDNNARGRTKARKMYYVVPKNLLPIIL